MMQISNLGWTVSLTLAAAASAQPQFFGVGELPGGLDFSQANGVGVHEALGPVATGLSTTSRDTNTAFRWTIGTGIRGLDGFNDVTSYVRTGHDVSGDGAVIVGSMATEFFQRRRAFAWTDVTGVVNLGNLPGAPGDTESYALAVSDDGRTIVGYAGYGFDGEEFGEAFRFTLAEGMVGLGDLPGGLNFSQARGVSLDGLVIVGVGHTDQGPEAFRWDARSGMNALGTLGGTTGSHANAVSSDSTVIVGQSDSSEGRQAAFWDSSGRAFGLGDLPGGAFESEALGVSGDGSVVVGWGTTGDGQEAFIWTSVDGMRSLAEVLADDYNLDLGGWTLTSANDISADGRVICGNGRNPNGAEEGWVLILEGGPDLVLSHSRLVQGQAAVLTASNAQAGETVRFLYSRQGLGDGPCVPSLGGLCLDLLNPIRLLGSATADANGVAVLTRTVPAGAPLIEVFLQAVAQRGFNNMDSVKSNASSDEVVEF